MIKLWMEMRQEVLQVIFYGLKSNTTYYFRAYATNKCVKGQDMGMNFFLKFLIETVLDMMAIFIMW